MSRGSIQGEVKVSVLSDCYRVDVPGYAPKHVAPSDGRLTNAGAIRAAKWVVKTLEARARRTRRAPASDDGVIQEFLAQRPASSRKLTTDGVRLDGNWMGGRGIAEWQGGKLMIFDLGSRAAQSVQRKLSKNFKVHYGTRTRTNPGSAHHAGPPGRFLPEQSAWAMLRPEFKSTQTGWSTHGEFYCPYCSTSIGKNLRGDMPHLAASRHLAEHGVKKNPATKWWIVRETDGWGVDSYFVTGSTSVPKGWVSGPYATQDAAQNAKFPMWSHGQPGKIPLLSRDDRTLRGGIIYKGFKKNPNRFTPAGPSLALASQDAQDQADELVMFIENDGDLHRQQHEPIIKNLLRKIAGKRYDYRQAPKLWGYLAENGAKKYCRDMPQGRPWNLVFPPQVRAIAAARLAKDFEWEVQNGQGWSYPEWAKAKAALGRKENPRSDERARCLHGKVCSLRGCPHRYQTGCRSLDCKECRHLPDTQALSHRPMVERNPRVEFRQGGRMRYEAVDPGHGVFVGRSGGERAVFAEGYTSGRRTSSSSAGGYVIKPVVDAVQRTLGKDRYGLMPGERAHVPIVGMGPACKRCKGAEQVRLGKNLVKCPLCKRKANPLTPAEESHLLHTGQRHLRDGRMLARTGASDAQVGFVAGQAYEDSMVLYDHGQSSPGSPRQDEATAIRGEAKEIVRQAQGRRRNPLDSHKHGCGCFHHKKLRSQGVNC